MDTGVGVGWLVVGGWWLIWYGRYHTNSVPTIHTP
jgi:hypothetical protein